MNHHIYHLREAELPASLFCQLAPFINAYKPHDKPPTKKDLDKDDYIPQESPLSKENILDTYTAIKHNQDLAWLKIKREYNSKWSGYRTHYNL
jgi:hypothetical protein